MAIIFELSANIMIISEVNIPEKRSPRLNKQEIHERED